MAVTTVSAAAILRDASRCDAPQDEVQRVCLASAMRGNVCASEPHRDELVGVKRLGLRHRRQDAQLLERAADDVDRLRIPGTVHGEAGHLRVINALDDALAHVERALLGLY